MTGDDVARLVEKVGLRTNGDGSLWGHMHALESFARLAVAAERERCCQAVLAMAELGDAGQRAVDAMRGRR